MLSVVFAILPVFLLILLGYGMKRADFPGAAFWPLADKLVYYLFFPSLLIENLARADLGDLDPKGLFGSLVGAILLNALLAYILRPLLKIEGPAFTSLFQGSVRFNTFVGFGAVLAFTGQAGITIYAVAISVAIPLINVLCVTTLLRFGSHGGSTHIGAQFGALMRNPLIISCLIGILLNISGMKLPPGIQPFFKMLGDVASPMGLLTVGAALQLDALRRGGRALAATVSLKLVVYPLVVMGFAKLWGLGELETQVLVLWAMLPTASASYILARQMGGDAPLMAAIVTATTVAAFISIPALFLAFGF